MKRLFTRRILLTGFVVFFSIQSKAHVEKTYFLQGKIGNELMTLKMLCYDEMPTRHLFYYWMNDKKDQYLKGNFFEGQWHFKNDEIGAADLIRNKLDISENSDGTWLGFWTDSTGKRQEIILQPHLKDTLSTFYNQISSLAELDLYEQYRLTHISFTKVPVINSAGHLLVDTYKENNTGIAFFRVRFANKQQKSDSVNMALENIHLSIVQEFFKYHPGKKNSETDFKILYLSDDLVSFKITSSTSPVSDSAVPLQQFITLNVHSGKPVDLEELVWFDNEKNKPAEGDLFATYKYRKVFFAPKIFGLLTNIYPQQMKSNSCGINNFENWALVEWSLRSNGLAIAPREAKRCNVSDWAIIPYETLKPFISKILLKNLQSKH